MNILDDIFCTYGTDKSSKGHNFSDVYHAVLSQERHAVKTVLEIGIFGTTLENAGASLKSWAEYFPNAIIYGVDLNDYSFLNTDRIKTIVADQGLIPGNLDHVIAEIGGEIDLIVDDGSHMVHHQQTSFGYLFKFLKSGGYYIIEDLQTSYHKICNPTGTEYNTLLILEMLRHSGAVLSDYISDAYKLHIQRYVASCEIHKLTPFVSETSLIRKRQTLMPCE